MNLKYKVLASLSLQHDYYTDGRCPDFSIVPAPETLAVLKNLGAVYKMTGSKLVILVRADENGKAFIPVPGDQSFTFYMVSENPLFFNISNITQQPASHLRYYFTNRSNNQLATDVRYLNQMVDLYEEGNSYQVGDLASGDGVIAEAIKSSDSALPRHINDPEYWSFKNNTILSYVNKNDLTEFVSPVYNYTLDTPAKTITIDVYRYNAYGSQGKAQDTITETYDTNQTSGSVWFKALPAGYYNIVVNGKSKKVYLDAEALYSSVFGVVELFTRSDGSPFAMIGSGGVLMEPEYVLRFASRSVVWKYLTNENISGVAFGSYDFHYTLDTRSGLKSYVSNIPIPLVQEIASADAPVKMKPDDSTETIAVPAADNLSRITLELDGDTYFCIEKYLPY